ncbi:MAG: N-acetylmuramoyl-L-alanine amidase-like domain-containing protein [Allomuricauda sp.]
MNRIFPIPLALFLLTTCALQAQIVCAPNDSVAFSIKMDQLEQMDNAVLENPIMAVGKSFLGMPYVEKTLEIGETESLVVNLRGFDCTTYVENVLAFGLLLQNKEQQFENFAKNLETIRYRNGKLDGYPSRLHYFTEWIRNNEQKGLVKNITNELGGKEHKKAINFMGTHRELYPFLADDQNYQDMLQVEKELAKESLCILAQDEIENKEDNIRSGDIIALATSIKGLDVTHTGFAIEHNGRIHLLHASSSGSVRITQEPLVNYLKKIKSNIGIIVARPSLLSP